MSEEALESAEVKEVWSRFEVEKIVPDFRLPTLDGGVISPGDYRDRKNMVILCLDIERTEDWEVLWEVARRHREFADANAQVLAVVSASKEEAQICLGDLKLPFPVLYEDAESAEPRMLGDQPYLFVADRFGELKSITGVASRKLDDVLDRAITTLELIELECPECGVPTWAI